MLVRASCEASQQRYGSPRVHEDLLEQDEPVSGKRVVRLMQEDELKARLRKRYKLTTMSDHDQPVAANLLDRQFEADAPNQRWGGATTEFVIGESGKLPVRDSYARTARTRSSRGYGFGMHGILQPLHRRGRIEGQGWYAPLTQGAFQGVIGERV